MPKCSHHSVDAMDAAGVVFTHSRYWACPFVFHYAIML